jgi:flavin reductase (DIM6/NTAB) family NADH-FMN oxidoreductase RutF
MDGPMNIPEPAREIEAAHFRRVMGRFATGVTVITARAHGEVRGMTANAFMSGSLEPPLCIISVTKRAHMHAQLEAAGAFAVNILTVGQENYANHFAGRPIPDLHPPFADVDGVPTLADASARIVAELASTTDCGDHTIFIGHIRWMAADDRPPLLYHAGRFAYLVPAHGEDVPHPEFW